MKWWNPAFNAQGSKVIIVVVQAGLVKNICNSSGGGQGKRQDRMKLSLLQPKLVEKLVSVPVLALCKGGEGGVK